MRDENKLPFEQGTEGPGEVWEDAAQGDDGGAGVRDLSSLESPLRNGEVLK